MEYNYNMGFIKSIAIQIVKSLKHFTTCAVVTAFKKI